MTAVAAPPEPTTPEPPIPPARPDEHAGPSRPARRSSHLVVAELALVLLTGSAVYGFSRIFDSLSFLGPLLTVAVVAHLTAGLCRRRGVPLPLAFVATVLTWGLTTTWLFFADTTLAGLPTLSTWDAASAELQRSWTAFNEVVAPAPAQTGFLLAAAGAVAMSAFLSDWAAFRLWSAREAVVPPLTLFVFATLLASDRQRIASAVVFVGAGVLFVVAHRVARLELASGWVTAERSKGGRSLLRTGFAIALVAVLAGALVGPRLPGADEDPLVDWRRDEDSPSSRTLVSPLVDIRQRIVDQSDTEAFTVEAAAPAYWRLTALDQFDGDQWRMEDRSELVEGALPGLSGTAASGPTLTQNFTLATLTSEDGWLPAAFQPAFVASSDLAVAYIDDTSTLLAADGDVDTSGRSYEVRSVVPDLTPDQLRAQSLDQVPDSIRGPMTELPGDFSEVAARQAEEVVAAAQATTPYDQAIALQTWFRTNFTYSLDIREGHSESAINLFLETRTGYCEQFAGTFAAMARHLGIPARVGVGFTWGEADPEQPDRYVVRGRDAHAWPEVYFADYGWVSFEPTPGRGDPSTESYTEVPAQQSGPEDLTPETVPGETTTTTAAPTTTTSLAPGEALPLTPGAAAEGDDTSLGRQVLTGLLLVVVLAALYAVAVPAGIAVRHARRRRGAGRSPTAAVAVAWAEAAEQLGLVGLDPRPAETHVELARRAATALPECADAITDLAHLADLAVYGPGAIGAAERTRAEDDRAAVAASVANRLGPVGRVVAALDPRRLLSAHPSRHRASVHTS